MQKYVRSILLSKCAAYGNNNSRFMKEKEAKTILSSSGLKTPLSNIPLFGDITQ